MERGIQNNILSVLKGNFEITWREFTDVDWLHCFFLGSIKTRFAICEDENGELRYIRAIQGHSGGMIFSPRLINYVMISYKWKRFIYHVDRARDQYSLAEIGLVVGGKEREEGRQTIFFTSLDPFNNDADEAESSTDTTKPSKVKYQIHWRIEQDVVSWIHLSTAHDAGLEFWQTGAMPLLRSSLCPKNASSRLSAKVGKESCSRDSFTPRERPKLTLRPSWVHARSNTVSMPRETDSNLQAWNSDSNASGSRTWPKEELQQSIDLRVDGIPNDETYTDEQYMQRIAEQVQKHPRTTFLVRRP